ncbi:MAG: alpha-glucosidase [Eggerthellaceae bacterium]|nr:alpha-glucosidase [Eggerthellaceae bacterium]
MTGGKRIGEMGASGTTHRTLLTRRQAIGVMAMAGATVAATTLTGCSFSSTPTDSSSSNTDAPDDTVSNAAQACEDLKWWQNTIVYEAYPKSFMDTVGGGTGTIDGIAERLDYLTSLGIGAIWLTPVYRSPMKDNGYDVADYYDIDPMFGTMDDMDDLIDEAAQHDIRIVMDLVMNHTSDENAWFQESSSSRDNDKADWYIWRDAKEDGTPPTNWRSIFGGSAWTWCEARQQYYLHTFADFQPDLNWECQAMREELYRMANFWLDKGLGGFRIDAVTYIKKPAFEDGTPDDTDGLCSIHDATANTPGILDLLSEFKQNVMEGSDAFTVGEANGVTVDELPQWVGEDGVFDMVFEFNHILVPLGGKEIWYQPADWKLTDLKAALTASQKATATNGWYPIYFENHDQARSVSQFLPGASDPQAGAKMLGCVLMTLRGTPFVFEGEELGYQNVAWPSIDDYEDVSSLDQYQMALEAGCSEEEALACVHAHSRDNARTPMQWDASENAGFTTGDPWLPVHDDYQTCNVLEQESDDSSVLAWYRSLTLLRNEYPVLVSGDYHELMAEREDVYAFERTCGTDRAVTLANFTENEVTFETDIVNGLEYALGTHGEGAVGTLRPFEAVVFANL